jgi:hypothetical protein
MKKPCDLHRMFIYRRINHSQIQTYAELFPYIPKGSLLNTPYPSSFELDMAISNEGSFVPDYSNVTNIDYSNVSSYMS